MNGQPLDVRVADSTSHPGGVFSVDLGPNEIEELRDVRSIVVDLTCSHDCRGVRLPSSQLSYQRVKVAVNHGVPSATTVALPVPDDAPISFAGKLIRNRWSVDVSLDVARSSDRHVASLAVLVVPRNGLEHWTSPHPLG